MGNILTNTSYSKAEIDSMLQSYQSKTDLNSYALKTELGALKTELGSSLSNHALKSDLNNYALNSNLKTSTIWCADGEICNIPANKKGIQLGNYKIINENNKLCVSDSTNATYCYDGKIITKV